MILQNDRGVANTAKKAGDGAGQAGAKHAAKPRDLQEDLLLKKESSAGGAKRRRT